MPAALGNFGSIQDTTELKAEIAKRKTNIEKLRTEANNAQDTGNKNDRQDFDYFGAAIKASEDIYNVYKTIEDAKLELLKEQTERELQVVQDRFDRESTIRNSALEAGIISQEQATEAEARAHKKKTDNENKINK